MFYEEKEPLIDYMHRNKEQKKYKPNNIQFSS